MSLSPARWIKNADPVAVIAQKTAVPPAPLRAWEAGGDILQMIEGVQARATAAAQGIAAMAEQHGVSLMHKDGQFYFFLERDEADEDAVPEGWRRTGASDYSYWIESKDASVNKRLAGLNHDLSATFYMASSVYGHALRNYHDYRKDEWHSEGFQEKSEATRDSVVIQKIGETYYISASAVGIDMPPACKEVPYADYLMVLARHYAPSVSSKPAPGPLPFPG